MAKINVPQYQEILWPTLLVLKLSGGSASNGELSELVSSEMKLSDEILETPHNEGPLSKFDYRSAWARTHLKMIGAVDNSTRGVWSITEFGKNIIDEQSAKELVKNERSKRQKEKNLNQQEMQKYEDSDNNSDDNMIWEEHLLTVIRNIDPSAFERLCQRVLRESNFTKVEVTGQSGDGGIDGTGVLRINPLLSIQILFQCKRYSGSVGPSEIRDFRGAMVGRTDHGLFITTGRFTKDAEREAIRDGAPAIELIDGMELCKILKTLELGVHTEMQEKITLDHNFFEKF